MSEKKSLRLCILGNAASIHTQRWVTYFSRRGHDVNLLSLTPGEVPGARLYVLGQTRKPGRWDYLKCVPTVRRIVRHLAPDILHAHYAGGYGLLGALAGYRPLVISGWGSDVLLVPRTEPILRWMIRACLNHADLVTSVAVHMTDSIRTLGVNSRIITLPFGADTNVFKPRRFDPGQPSGLIVSTRHLEPIYNIGLLIEALPTVLAAVPSARAVLIGEGSMRPQLEQRVCELGLNQRVAFTGKLPAPEIASYLSEADVYVSTSLSDGNNISLNEAMACGAFPVATNIVANREWIDDGANGFLVDTEDPGQMAEKILTGLRCPPLRSKAAKLNWERVQQKGTWKTSMEIMEKEYFSLARPRN